MKYRFCWFAIGLVLFLAACQEVKLISTGTEFPGNVIASPSTALIEPSIMPTDIAQSTVAPVYTFTPSTTSNSTSLVPTTTPSPTLWAEITNINLLDEEGAIWAYIKESSQYLVIDLDQGSYYLVNGPPAGCRHTPLALKFDVICKRESDGRVYLYDLITGNIQELPIVDASTIWASSVSGDYILYDLITGSDSHTLYSYNLTNQTITTVASLSLRGWSIIPHPSPDGKYLVGVYDGYLAELDQATGEYRMISSDVPRVTDNVAWSPVASQFAYGATDLAIEIGVRANYLYLMDMESGQIRLLATPPYAPPHNMYDEYGWPVWSPDGDKIATLSGAAICIIIVGTGEQTCEYRNIPDNADNYLVNWVTWSPNGKYIAFLEYGLNDGNLVLFSLADEKFDTLLSDIDITGLFWR